MNDRIKTQVYRTVYADREIEFRQAKHSKILDGTLHKQKQKNNKDLSFMKTIVEKVINEYSTARTQAFAGHPLGLFFRSEIPQRIYNTGIVNEATHLVMGSTGQGRWVDSAWFAIFDRNLTTSARKGVYVVYLLSKDGNTLYLTLNQGCENIRASHSKGETILIMREKAKEIVGKLDMKHFKTDENINLGSGLTDRAEMYQKGTICYKEYKKGLIPSETELRNDLSSIMDIYKAYAQIFKTGTFDSWEIVDDVTAIKTCDKSFFAYNGSGVPKEICWFFNAEEIPTGGNKSVKLIFEGKEFIGKLTNDTTDRRRIQIRWNSDLTKNLEQYKTDDAKAKFVKVQDDVYELEMDKALFDTNKFNEILIAYKEAIRSGWLKNEKYKWEAIKCFQDNWDIEESNFEEMWLKATAKTFNLLANMNNFPKKMIHEFCKRDKEAVRQMFKNLFDESAEITGRIRNFIDSAEELRVKYGEDVWKNHYQTVNAVSTYLWLRYPDEYYIFKYQDCKNATEKMGCSFSIKKGEPMDNVIRAFKLFDSVAEIFKKDEDIINIRENYLDNECYTDELFRTFAIDFIYYASRQYDKNETEKGGEPEMTIKEKIQNIKSYIAAKGFNYEGELIENFYLSLKSKPFVILAGTSGTGKTKLVKLFAEAIGAEMKLVPVRPDWSDSSDLFGHVDLASNFKPGAIIDFVKQAELDKNKPYFFYVFGAFVPLSYPVFGRICI